MENYFLRRHENDERQERLKIDDGVIQDTSGDVIFKIEFMAIASLPQLDEVLDGRVIEVKASGIIVQSGPIETHISLTKDCSDYVYDQQLNVWVKRDEIVDQKLEKNVHVRYRITQAKYLMGKFSVVGTIFEDVLGPSTKHVYHNMMRD